MPDLDEVDGALRPGYEALQHRLISGLSVDDRIRVILLTGSAARGLADLYSDLDLGIVVEDGTVAAVAESCLTRIGPLAHSTMIERGPVVIVSALTIEGLRVDVLVDRLRAADGAAARPEPLVAEFLRVLALLEVVIGRDEYFVGAQGVMLLREYLVDLFYIENGRTRTGGRKRVNDELTTDQQALLASQPALPTIEPRSSRATAQSPRRFCHERACCSTRAMRHGPRR